MSFDSIVTFSAKEGEDAIWIKNYSFSNGRIEVDLQGKNLQGQSFVGVAFHSGIVNYEELGIDNPNLTNQNVYSSLVKHATFNTRHKWARWIFRTTKFKIIIIQKAMLLLKIIFNV